MCKIFCGAVQLRTEWEEEIGVFSIAIAHSPIFRSAKVFCLLFPVSLPSYVLSQREILHMGLANCHSLPGFEMAELISRAIKLMACWLYRLAFKFRVSLRKRV